MHLILFIVFAALCLTGAVNLLLQKHPINSALSLIVVMTSLAVLYLLLGAEFLAAAQVIVYAGAIMVLFTFVVMLLNACPHGGVPRRGRDSGRDCHCISQVAGNWGCRDRRPHYQHR